MPEKTIVKVGLSGVNAEGTSINDLVVDVLYSNSPLPVTTTYGRVLTQLAGNASQQTILAEQETILNNLKSALATLLNIQ